MPADAQTQAFLDKIRSKSQAPPGSVPITEFRRAMDAFKPLAFDREEVAEVREASVPTHDGTSVRVRIYRPSQDRDVPVVVWAHGGSWVRCDLETHDRFFRVLARRSGCVLVGVDYRLAPEHRFPVALEDVGSAVRWAAERADSFGGDRLRVAVGGESSGGNLAAATCLLAKERGYADIALQVLFAPVLDARFDSPSWKALGEDYLLTPAQLEWAVSEYAPDVARDDPLLSPLWAGSYDGLPDAVIVTGELDPLQDDGRRYAETLERAGVGVTYRCIPGMIHHAMLAPQAMDVGVRAVDDLGAMIRQALGTVPA